MTAEDRDEAEKQLLKAELWRTIGRYPKAQRDADRMIVHLMATIICSGWQSPTSLAYSQAKHERAIAEKAWAEGAEWAAIELGAIHYEHQQWIAPGDNPYELSEMKQ